MNENNRIDNPQIKIVKYFGLKAQDEKCVETSQKQTMDVIFNKQNSQLLTRSFPVEEIIQVNGQNRPVPNLPVIDFRSQPREMPLNMKLSLFRSVFWFSSPSRKVWTSLSVCLCDKVRLNAYESRDRKWLSVCNSPPSNVMKAINTV